MADEFHLVEKSRIMDSARMKRALSRLASEIVEENQGAKDLYIVGIRRRGVPLAERIVDKIEAIEGDRPQYGIIDITPLPRRPFDSRGEPDRQSDRARRRHRGKDHRARRRRSLHGTNDSSRRSIN
jgi:pyrimidine operon attenuation protein/uracil phosphoribosyltransferase